MPRAGFYRLCKVIIMQLLVFQSEHYGIIVTLNRIKLHIRLKLHGLGSGDLTPYICCSLASCSVL
jgi:hypothetical protein